MRRPHLCVRSLTYSSSFSIVVCSLAGNYAFFIHIRFPNIITEKMQWLSVGCGPIIKSESEDSAEKARVQVLKDAIFQRCLAILMHRFVPVSQYGEPMTVPGEEEPVLAVPRVVLYAADQPEERRVLGFKLRGCKRPCSHCLVGKHDAACRGPKAAVRDVLEHVDLQLDAAEALEDGAGQARMAQIEGGSSIVPIISALAAALGLGTGPCCLYQIFRSFSFVALLSCSRPILTPTLLFISVYIWCNSNLYRCLVRKGVVQATLKGRQWRHGVVVWAFMVAGLIGRREPGSTDPCFECQRRRRHRGVGASAGRRSASFRGRPSAVDRSGTDDDYETDSDVDSEVSRVTGGGRAQSDVGTDDVISGGEERVEDAPVQKAAESSDAYKELFGSRPIPEAVVHVVCLTARLMGELCGDNLSDDVRLTEAGALELLREAYDLVCRYIAVLFGPINTTKMHALGLHLKDELLNRGNLFEADTSVNESLHGLIKAMFENTNKKTTSFAVQMLRCQQTLVHIVAEDSDDNSGRLLGCPPLLASRSGVLTPATRSPRRRLISYAGFLSKRRTSLVLAMSRPPRTPTTRPSTTFSALPSACGTRRAADAGGDDDGCAYAGVVSRWLTSSLRMVGGCRRWQSSSAPTTGST